MKQSSEIAIVGRACRLPGANSIEQLWRLLREGTCAVTEVPSDRWSLERFGHPRHSERGRSYTWAAGVLDDIWSFDAAAFGLSPREAEQMDPQQRLLLELTWEALEDAGIRPSSLIGTETGVFIGASTTDHGNSKMFDIAATDGYFATGNAASILANRISYVYDLNGPSFTVDTACSSSLVAFDAAVQAIQAGRIETAIVGGVSILTTPFQFVNFSQASMLSRIGLCQAFSAKADGYVRSEGGGVLVLRSTESAARGGDRIHARIVGTRVNSDGRTNGIALPSKKRQAQLLDQLYHGGGIDPDRLAFVEAHGTGTPVGDPVEAGAIGEVLGQRRTKPLPIGSIKSNIGHTEAAAGIAGLLKAMLALEHDLLPATLHCDDLNPNIDFERLNLAVAAKATVLERSGDARLAGVSSYGFGGTNAHVVLADAPSPSPPPKSIQHSPSMLILSGHSRAALSALAAVYADRLDGDPQTTASVAAAANWRRERLDERVVIPLADPAGAPDRLRAFARDGAEAASEFTIGTAVARDAQIAFVYSGNGGQWAGMGREAYRGSTAFRERFDTVDRIFQSLSGWSLAAVMTSDDLGARLVKTSVAQPLIFAIQSASTFALAELGLRPSVVFGHSVGEVAAAEAAGILDVATAVKVIYFRSLHQELAFEAGGMTVLIGSKDAAEQMAADIPGLMIAAYNSPRAFTFSGTTEGLTALAVAARGLKARAQKLDIAYPFHSPLIDAIKAPLLNDLAELTPRTGNVAFVSTVTGAVIDGEHLDARYWWRNVREPVLFSQSVEAASKLGSRIFVEIGPSPILLSHINDTLAAGDAQIATIGVLDRKQQTPDPFRKAVANALARGAGVQHETILGTDPGPGVALPTYPWQRKTYRLGETADAIAFLTPRPWHPLIGSRYVTDQLEWHAQIDTALIPGLADHVVDGHVLLPGAAFAEMALAAARDWLGSETASIANFEIHQPMILASTASRDIRLRIQPATGTLEIMSRARLGQAAWQVHAVAKVLHQVAIPDPTPSWPVPSDAEVVTGETVYALAAASGLTYGPSFQLLDTARRTGPGTVVVDLVEGAEADPRYGLDPAQVDACFHGLVLLYANLAVEGRLKPYVPVGAAEVKLFQPGVAIARAYIEVVRSDERSMIVHFTLTDRADRPVASLHRMRFQAMSAFRSGDRTIDAIRQTSVLAAEPLAVAEGSTISAADVIAAARATKALCADGDAPGADYVLLDGWATATAYGLFEILAENGIIAVDALVANGRLPGHLSGWCLQLLSALAKSGLVIRTDGGDFTVASGADLPDPADILRAIAADHPERSAELLLAARTGAIVDGLAAALPDRATPVTTAALDSFEFGGHAATGSAAMIGILLDHLGSIWPDTRAIRILQVGDGPLTARTARMAAATNAELTLVEPDRRRLERAKLAVDRPESVTFESKLANLAPASFDLVVAAQSLHRIATDSSAWTRLSDAMAPSAVLMAIEPESSVFRTMVFGLHAASGEPSDDAAPLIPASEAGWTRALQDLPLTDVSVFATAGTDFGLLCVGQKSPLRAPKSVKGDAVIVGHGAVMGKVSAALATMLRFSGLKVASMIDPSAPIEIAAEADTIVYLADAAREADPAGQIVDRCLELRHLAASLTGRKIALWIVCPGALRAASSGGSAVEAGVWAFCRTLANEMPSLDIRLIDLVAGLSADVAARRLRDVVLSGTAETDILVDAAATRVVRFEKLGAEAAQPPSPGEVTIRLVKGESAGLDRLQWMPQQRRPPQQGEVEIEVAAAGLNFRDVMWGLSILPEEILEDGYAGATLGLECAGRIVRIGSGVTGFNVGDQVLAFAKAALSTHVTVMASVAAVIPSEVSPIAAATIPVAFLTAYYALIRCAHLAEDEWVLIHGGAGGVGLAALQIARWRGARIIATAGSSERRDLLTALGADHVFDSRSNQFVDDIRRVTGHGVDVVLNSLSGEAMERSIAVLRPFGRFVELGKRDYVANTHIGLKPFRRNLSYFGVDLDQLILKDDTTGQTLFEDVMKLFSEGALAPLPYRVFEAGEVVDAFRVMQRSGHVGKIVILPPAVPQERPEAREPFVLNPNLCHLITGGLGGFGIETARWLVDGGARHLVLAGRSGATTPEARAALQAFASAGVAVTLAKLDIADESEVRALFDRFGTDLPALAGVIHAAAVIDDAIVANLTRAKLDGVLSAKVRGADILDRLTRTTPLDYFILYSSATTMIGNPGQGAYVAANGYLEGLARARRHRGLPGLAIAWGAIEDVGILARSGAAAVNLLARSGVGGMTARHALDRLADMLPRAMSSSDDAVLTLAAVNWSTAREHLPVLKSRSFGKLMHGVQTSDTGGKGKIRVRTLIEQEGVTEASKQVLATILEEIARILRLPRDDVSRSKPLMEIGLDSLMAVELGMGLEERFELDAPLSTSAGAMTVTELADYIVGTNTEGGQRDPTSEGLALRHLDADIRKDLVEALPSLTSDGIGARFENTH